MATLLELAQHIVMAHVSTTPMTSKEMISEIQQVHAALQALERGQAAPGAEAEHGAQTISKRRAFGKAKVTCMICGKEMTTLARHLGAEHGMKPSEYRKQFDIPRTQPLAAKNYSESRRQMAIDLGLGEGLAKARAARGKSTGTGAKKKGSKKNLNAPAAE